MIFLNPRQGSFYYDGVVYPAQIDNITLSQYRSIKINTSLYLSIFQCVILLLHSSKKGRN